MFTDQRWVDFVPSFFDHHILKDPGYNVAYWNLHARDVRYDGGRYLVDGAPLRFFHFSGFDPRKPWLLSKHQGDRPRVLLSERPVLARICEEYRERLDVYGSNADARQPYGWNRLPSGMPLTARMRRFYWEAIKDAEEGKGPEPPGPFDASGADAFVAWLNSPSKGGPRGVSRFLYSIYEERPDLRMHFPDVGGKDAGALRRLGVERRRPAGRNSRRAPSQPRPRRAVGRADLGRRRREHRRLLPGRAGHRRGRAAARRRGRCRRHPPLDDRLTMRRSAGRRIRFRIARRGAAYDINVVCVNADSTPKFAGDVGPGFFRGRHTAGYWFWEVEDFPESMHAAFDIVDEVWTATDFIARAVRGAGVKPVFTVPLPVSVPRFSPSLDRAHFGLSDAFTFVFIFDFLSIFERKNPLGLISAFTTAFAPGEGPVLVLKSINGEPPAVTARAPSRGDRRSARRADRRRLLHGGREERARRRRATATCRCTARRDWD